MIFMFERGTFFRRNFGANKNVCVKILPYTCTYGFLRGAYFMYFSIIL